VNKIFSGKLKEYRKELELKRNEKVGQVRLAEELGVSKGNIGDLECGSRMPSKKLLVKLVEHSGKSLSYWMEGIEEYEAPNTVDLVLDKMIEKGLIKDTELSGEVWEIIKKAVLLEIERKIK
jgi:transcriptional regulator with XRE-family HTH domain